MTDEAKKKRGPSPSDFSAFMEATKGLATFGSARELMDDAEESVERLRPYLDQLPGIEGGDEVLRDEKGDDQC